MKLSIIIPVYNEAPFLKRCLNSLHLVDGAEIIIIDDCSTDGSTEILKEYEEKHKGENWTFIYSEKNSGVSMARNRGIWEARGEYITFLDSDDSMSEDGIEKMVKALTGHTENIIQFNHYRCHDGECKIMPRYSSVAGTFGLRDLPPKWAPVWNKCYHQNLIHDYSIEFIYDQQFDEDRQFNLACFRVDPHVTVINEACMCKHFDNEQSLCHTMTHEKIAMALRMLSACLYDPTQSAEYYELVKSCMIQHLESKKFKETFGGSK